MAGRPPARKFEREEMVAYLHGIDAEANVVHLLVHKRGSKVRFTGGFGKHEVSPKNSGDLEQWVDEAQSALGLTDVIGVLRGWTAAPENVEKFAQLNALADIKKKELGPRAQPAPTEGIQVESVRVEGALTEA
jgi:hypothetical protein